MCIYGSRFDFARLRVGLHLEMRRGQGLNILYDGSYASMKNEEGATCDPRSAGGRKRDVRPRTYSRNMSVPFNNTRIHPLIFKLWVEFIFLF